VVPQLGGQRPDERRDRLRIREERVQIQPEGAVVAGLQSEVAVPSLGQAKERGEPGLGY
jgi:hypothetical protein